MAYPFERIDVGVVSEGFCGADAALSKPGSVESSECREIILLVIFHLFQFCDEGQVDPEPSERLDIASQATRASIHDAVMRFWVIEPVSESTVLLGVSPIGRSPRIIVPSHAKKRPVRPLRS